MLKEKTSTREKIIDVAREEFLNLGFEKASMRSIGNKVGISQAALYKHFKSKENMFSFIVSPAIEALKEEAKIHEETAYNIVNSDKTDFLMSNNDVHMFKELFYKYKTEFKLILCCSQGTRYQNFIHYLVEAEVTGTLKAIEFLAKKHNKEVKITKDELHLLLSAYITAIFEPIVHDWPLEKSIHGLETLERFFIPGWKEIMDI